MKFTPFAFAAVSAFALAACTPAEDTTPVQPAAVEEPVVEPVAEEPVTAPSTIVDIAAGNPDFSTLVAAVQAAGLAETLSGPGPFTVFAPTNAAFAALPAGTLDSLLLPENQDDLVKILSYHVVPGTVMAANIPAEADAAATASVNNLDLSIRTTATGAMVNDATVTTADIVASNGVIHVIDKVLLPRMDE